jgi:MauM/NapG family ferredoxin protein
MQLRRFRIASQTVFLLLFIWLLYKSSYPLTKAFPVDFFLRHDPLVALTAMLAARSIITLGLAALVLVVLTMLVGRYFCAYVCPLGTTIDVLDTLLVKRYRTKENHEASRLRRLKYIVLLVLLATALLGLNLVFLADPISMVTRVYTIVLVPPLAGLVNLAGGMAWQVRPYYFVFSTGVLLTLALVMLLNVWQSRFWCRNICPLGALLSFCSRWGLFKRVVGEGCNNCQKCKRVCPMKAIAADPRTTILSECTLCGNCVAACPRHDTRIAFRGFSNRGYDAKIEVSRRDFITGMAGAALTVGAARFNLNKKVADETLIRPPGALPEAEFLARCVRCGECMKACKTNCLQPAQLQSGWEGLWSPRGVFRRAGCEMECNLCGQVCPTGAIRNLPLEEKQFAKIGTAVIDRRRCVAWEQNLLCLICDEICPYDAITYQVVDEFTGPFKKPFVNEKKCVGCGMCEEKCPVHGKAAIAVTSDGEERLKKGSYITAEKRRMREIAVNEFETRDIVNFGEASAQGAPAPAEQAVETKSPLPAGFIE